MHTHHSHSGDYISHAHDSLNDMVNRYIAMGFHTVCLTEHMPRLDDKFLYPEELEKQYTENHLQDDFSRYLTHAKKLQLQHKDVLNIIVGLEIEGINKAHIEYAASLMQDPSIEVTVGSIHHVHEIPIDFSTDLWLKAKSVSTNGLTRSLYKSYFDLQGQVLDLKPTIVGHFDLIRLCQPVDDFDETTKQPTSEVNIAKDWPEVWEVVEQNVQKVVSYGGLFELNSSAIRKGWDTPYPKQDITQLIIKNGGKFCFSDDAHACSQVGLNYEKVLAYIEKLNIKEIYYLESNDGVVAPVAVNVEELKASSFWNQYV
ncbi:hypothetical protein PVL30_005309 [Lodderomyces elongisporus]|uniref:uncharacterized protein n=1 Tax=Lodderomyces elongisporus TaxID=36914 RepID=UPI0029238B87|nr:uncharacterized protein PVL30_005309 [Lodderomyces elongisporus]WLF81512.1 hypothetical protein PVL30_005309 [Lodderomyces elongisporus]